MTWRPSHTTRTGRANGEGRRSVRGADQPAVAQRRQLLEESAEPEIVQQGRLLLLGRAGCQSCAHSHRCRWPPDSKSLLAQVAAPPVYYATHDTQPPNDQGAPAPLQVTRHWHHNTHAVPRAVVTTERTNILLRQFQQRAESKKQSQRQKRNLSEPPLDPAKQKRERRKAPAGDGS